MNIAEFSKGQRITYWNGKQFCRAEIRNLNLNPLSMKVVYNLTYRLPDQKGLKKADVTADKIKESEFFNTGS
jgi:hypothetical protein